MPVERVLDASVAAAALFAEAHSVKARTAVLGGSLIAPDLVQLEFASVAVKKLKRGEIDEDTAQRAMSALHGLIDRFHPSPSLVDLAYIFAKQGRVSIYDALYLALAETHHTRVITLDRRLAGAAEALGRPDWVESLL